MTNCEKRIYLVKEEKPKVKITETEPQPEFEESLKEESEDELWYLVECPMWSESGWTIAEFDGDGFLCQTCGRHVSVDIVSFRELT